MVSASTAPPPTSIRKMGPQTFVIDSLVHSKIHVAWLRCSGDQVSLNIEGVVDGGVERNKVRMVQEHRGDQASQWAAIAAKIGCSGETLRNWVRQAERDAGVRPGATTDEPAMAA